MVPADRANGELFFERLRELGEYRWAQADGFGAYCLSRGYSGT
jgi:hypothetical protein